MKKVQVESMDNPTVMTSTREEEKKAFVEATLKHLNSFFTDRDIVRCKNADLDTDYLNNDWLGKAKRIGKHYLLGPVFTLEPKMPNKNRKVMRGIPYFYDEATGIECQYFQKSSIFLCKCVTCKRIDYLTIEDMVDHIEKECTDLIKIPYREKGHLTVFDPYH